MASIVHIVMARLNRTMTALFIAATIFATPAVAAPIGETQYRETMTALSEVQTLMLDTVDAIHTGLAPEDARARLPHLKERLQWMRDAKVEAARADTGATLRNMNDDNRRARCIVMRAGLMDERFQDIVVDVTLKARGVADAELLPLERKPVEEFTPPPGCPR
ncbi:MAG: hypothetical protein K8R18_16260 [Parvibaculum sp.]|uniref:hypothetical protein n=1 Tax=Parvibaculum sp. TaxID=2024848 RepID=UPI0025FC68BA|nr:hypothetical protein [Parvibaculum sp.]MCE9651174.1 hypothetical protein [Parvibaculum sp.]